MRKTIVLWIAAACGVCALPSCGSADSDDSNGAAGSAGQLGTCVAQPELVSNQGWPCQQAEPCDQARFDGQHLPYGPESATAARCILEKLRDRVPGEYQVTSDIENRPSGMWSISQVVNLLPDGTAVGSDSEFHDISGWNSSSHYMLKPPAFFDECVAKSDAELYDCLTSWRAEPADQCPICPAP